MYSRMLDKQLEEWLAEDVGSGDLTSEALLPEGAVTTGIIHAKDTGILCGVDVARQVFRVLDPSLTFEALAKDGDKLEPGTLIAKVTGSARSVLTGERLALNLLQHLSGIATRTRKLADLAKPYGTRVVDTRKTTPGLRLLEKYAVRTGGGHNHRLGLYDAILIKDNHIAVAGGVKEALVRAKAYASHMTKIEIEVESLAQAKEALEGGADVIMLDNMAPEAMKECVRMIGHRAVVEASGGIDEHNLEAAAAAGVDVISIGALTHSVKALDISLDVGEIK
ncbi:carboxylating nicotinate-nucleotide diphosphorylase [uncultured Acidaminococcus sp.]|uniref:carboxylating nicotinate-nucleotide diphosphorylase n=1 Tax=uncultured Acidaminococcus sp. TaxID=352152 RepID=UPI0026DD1F0A|nr:carboxylating nicotinate-nucleotide diphosphorylase [uncultured Acidaminococcus sp.]